MVSHECRQNERVGNQILTAIADANWRWVHDKNGYTNCYTGNTWNATICPDNKSCAANCVLDGADYAATYGATTSGNALSLKFVTQSSTKNIGSRLYLMESATKYKMFNLLNNEFSFDVDLSKLPVSIYQHKFTCAYELNRNHSAA